MIAGCEPDINPVRASLISCRENAVGMPRVKLNVLYAMMDSFHLRPLPRKEFWGFSVWADMTDMTDMTDMNDVVDPKHFKYTNNHGEGPTLDAAVRNLVRDLKARGVDAKVVADLSAAEYETGVWALRVLDDALEVSRLPVL